MPVDLEDDITERPERADVSAADEKLLNEIRERYRYYAEAWKDIRDERNTDIKFVSGDPWPMRDRNARIDLGRPVINHDELSQYVNQCVNNVRQNKRGIKIDPQGEGTNDQTARIKQDLIRTIEYDSDAPSIYANAFQDVVEGSYAFFRICTRYILNDAETDDPRLFDQEIVIKPIANPNSVLFAANCKEPDWSDAEDCFVVEPMPKAEFRRHYPNAQITDFSVIDYEISRDWIQEKQVLVAEYWRINIQSTMKYLLENGQVTSKPAGRRIKSKRKVESKTVTQYITNGIEILEKNEVPGCILPIIPMFGLERYLESDGNSKRHLFSLVRLARDPQLSLAYLNSQEMEEAGLTPKTPFLGYKGQFDSNREQWKTVTKQPWGFLEADIPDNWPAGQVPPLPTRVPFTPNFGAYEVAKDSCRRAIQAAMGISPLPTAAQRATEKSGIALQRIQMEADIGSFHFVDGYDRALRLAGKVIDQWIPVIYDSERTKALRQPDDSYRMVRLNTDYPYPDQKTNTMVHYPVPEEDHTVSISTGPSYQSQREATAEFIDSLLEKLPALPIPPPVAAKILSLAIQMRDLGPKGDEIAELIAPTEGSPMQGMQQMQQAQAQVQQQGLIIQQLQAELQKLTAERQAKVVEGEYRLASERMRAQSDLLIERLKIDAQLASSEVMTKSQVLSERMAAVDELYKQAHEQLHEARAQQADQQHEMAMAQQAQQAAQQQQAMAAQQQAQQPQEQPAPEAQQ